MGITLLAAGTSVPDAMASLFVAKQGQVLVNMYLAFKKTAIIFLLLYFHKRKRHVYFIVIIYYYNHILSNYHVTARVGVVGIKFVIQIAIKG